MLAFLFLGLCGLAAWWHHTGRRPSTQTSTLVQFDRKDARSTLLPEVLWRQPLDRPPRPGSRRSAARTVRGGHGSATRPSGPRRSGSAKRSLFRGGRRLRLGVQSTGARLPRPRLCDDQHAGWRAMGRAASTTCMDASTSAAAGCSGRSRICRNARGVGHAAVAGLFTGGGSCYMRSTSTTRGIGKRRNRSSVALLDRSARLQGLLCTALLVVVVGVAGTVAGVCTPGWWLDRHPADGNCTVTTNGTGSGTTVVRRLNYTDLKHHRGRQCHRQRHGPRARR